MHKWNIFAVVVFVVLTQFHLFCCFIGWFCGVILFLLVFLLILFNVFLLRVCISKLLAHQLISGRREQKNTPNQDRYTNEVRGKTSHKKYEQRNVRHIHTPKLKKKKINSKQNLRQTDQMNIYAARNIYIYINKQK